MSSSDIHYRRNLPHYHPDGYTLFITFRLADSLPLNVLVELKEQRERDLKSTELQKRAEIENKYFLYFDKWLDRYESSPSCLKSEEIAQIVLDEIKGVDQIQYNLIACCIMPNHVHLLIEPLEKKSASHSGNSAKYPVTDALRLIKGRTARKSNLKLGRNGTFWQHESYDHYVRNDQELEKIILYISNNPVKVGLVKDWKDWKYTYVSPQFGKW